MSERRIDTRVVHAGLEPDPTYGSVIPPIHQTSTFRQTEPGLNKGYCYARTGNPTRSALEENLAALENARYGLAFASGMAADARTMRTVVTTSNSINVYPRSPFCPVELNIDHHAGTLQFPTSNPPI